MGLGSGRARHRRIIPIVGGAVLESGNDRYGWVNHTLFICAGIRRASAVENDYY